MTVQATHKTPSRREEATQNAIRVITSLMRCVLWLIKHGVFVTGFRGAQKAGVDAVTVTVAASPYLHTLMPDSTWRQRRQAGLMTIYTFIAIRHGVAIEWEVEECRP